MKNIYTELWLFDLVNWRIELFSGILIDPINNLSENFHPKPLNP